MFPLSHRPGQEGLPQEGPLSPFRGFGDMQSQMNRMFDEMLGNLGGRSPARQLEGVTG